jgi:acyl-CoA synthetase (AMP-forming)/AMP-acid ligase II
VISICDEVFSRLSDAAGTTVLSCAGSQWTGSDALREAESWGRRFAGAGLIAGDACALSLPSGPELAMACVAAMSAGLHVALLNPYLGSQDRAKQLELVSPVIHIVADDGPVAQDETSVPTVRVDDMNTVGFEPLPRAVGGHLIGFTSGTSGPSKAVIHSLPRMRNALLAYQEVFALRPRQHVVCVLPLYLVAAFVPSVLYGLWAGARISILPRFNVDDLSAHLDVVDYMMAVPAIYRELVSSKPELIAKLHDTRWLICGASPLDEKTRVAWRSAGGGPLSTCSGSTEAGGYISVDVSGGQGPAGSAGKPFTHVDVRIFGEHDRELPTGADGSLTLGRDGIFLRYLGDGDRAAGAARFHTGDIARLDQDGFLYYAARTSDVINRGGFKIVPSEVEAAISQMAGIEACVVVPAADDRLGEVPIAFVESASPVSLAQLREFMSGRLASYKIPLQLRTAAPGELPRGLYGKWDRRSLRAQAAHWRSWD